MNIALQRKTDLAIRFLRSIGVPGTRVSGASIADSIGTTTTFLPQVAAPLIQRGWVASTRGPGGGYSVTDAAHEITLFDVIEATEGPTVDGRCVLKEGPCPGAEACPAHDAWTVAREVLIDGFRRVPAIPREGEVK